MGSKDRMSKPILAAGSRALAAKARVRLTMRRHPADPPQDRRRNREPDRDKPTMNAKVSANVFIGYSSRVSAFEFNDAVVNRKAGITSSLSIDFGIVRDAPSATLPMSDLWRCGRPAYSRHSKRINPVPSFSRCSQTKASSWRP